MDAAIDGPVIVAANWYRFRPTERLRHAQVLSLCFVWPMVGHGRIITRGRAFDLRPGHVLRLPWDHDIEYQADSRTPFEVGTIHVVPRHSSTVRVEPRVAHQVGDPLLLSEARRGDRERSAALLSSATGAGARLIELGGVGIRRFDAEGYDEGYFRHLAGLILLEDAAAEAMAVYSTRAGAIEAMVRFVTSNIHRSLSVREVADSGDCSISTAQRLFRAQERCTIQQFVRRRKMDEAATLLRTTSYRVSEVAAALGFDDPLHFSRVFKTAFGVPPSQFATGELRP